MGQAASQDRPTDSEVAGASAQSKVNLKKMVAAIDFGTTFSGYAYSSRSDFSEDPLKISHFYWESPFEKLSTKTKTCILFDNKEEFHSFGFEAEKYYLNLVSNRLNDGWHFFEHFKMMLYDDKDLKRTSTVKDIQGFEMPAMKVFTESIRFLKDHLLKVLSIGASKGGSEVKKDDIQWVLTVPAIWEDGAKQFMREAAVQIYNCDETGWSGKEAYRAKVVGLKAAHVFSQKVLGTDHITAHLCVSGDGRFLPTMVIFQAGIDGGSLSIVLEPEAVALYCKYRFLRTKGEERTPFQPNKKYVVVDVGGGTVDITAHVVQEDGALHEVYKANGGAWGGDQVNNAFIQHIIDLVGTNVFTSFKREHTSDLMDLLFEFEFKKRYLTTKSQEELTFNIPTSIQKLYEQTNERRLLIDLAEKKQVKGDKLLVTLSDMKQFHSVTCKHIADHLTVLLAKPAVIDTDQIILAGGFAQSPFLRNEMEEAFDVALRDRRLTASPPIVTPEFPNEAVVRGAVILEHDHSTILSRIARHTYGVSKVGLFRPSVHPESRRIILGGRAYCDSIFDKHVTLEERVRVGTFSPEKKYVPVPISGIHLRVKIYKSDQLNPEYIDDQGCEYRGVLPIDFTEVADSRKKVAVKFIYGNTELSAESRNIATGEISRAHIDFL